MSEAKKPTTYNELAAKGDTTTTLTPLVIDDLREWLNRYPGHGHAIHRPDECIARCGGPAICKGCQAEAAIVEAMKVIA